MTEERLRPERGAESPTPREPQGRAEPCRRASAEKRRRKADGEHTQSRKAAAAVASAATRHARPTSVGKTNAIGGGCVPAARGHHGAAARAAWLSVGS